MYLDAVQNHQPGEEAGRYGRVIESGRKTGQAIPEIQGHLDQGEGDARGVTTRGGAETVQALGDRPAVVDIGQERRHVDLLIGVLTDVGDQHIASLGIEAEAKRVAQAV